MNHLARFGRALCENFPRLQAEGHPKWREVDLSLPQLGPGWTYYAPTARELRACAASARTRPAPKPPAKACTSEERILGRCS